VTTIVMMVVITLSVIMMMEIAHWSVVQDVLIINWEMVNVIKRAIMKLVVMMVGTVTLSVVLGALCC